MSSFYHFAYGSNLLESRMHKRVGRGALFQSEAQLSGHTVCYHKRSSKDGSGKLTVVETGNTADVVHGVVYRICPADMVVLDKLEGLGYGYEKKEVSVEVPSGFREVVLYSAVPDVIDPLLLPYEWYMDLIVAGARQRGFPEEYIRALLIVQAMLDPDEKRDRRNRKLL